MEFFSFLSGIFAQIFGQIAPIKKRDQERHIWYCQFILKWKRCHFRLTFVAQKRLCFISLMTKLVRSRWLVIGLVLFCFYIVLDLTVHKSEKKNLVSIQPYWPQAWSINLHTSLPHGVTRCVNSPNRCHFVSLFTPPPPSTRPIWVRNVTPKLSRSHRLKVEHHSPSQNRRYETKALLPSKIATTVIGGGWCGVFGVLS